MQFLYGKPLADEILSGLKRQIALSGITPGLAVVLIGDDPASHIYVGLKERAAQDIGMRFERHVFPAAVLTETVLERIRMLNANPDIHGIIVQLPLPETLDEEKIIQAILPEKDADGFHPETLRRYFAGEEKIQPVFPRAVARLIRAAGKPLTGKKAVALVNSEIFGRAMKQVFRGLELDGAIIVRKEWTERKAELKQADVLVTACGEPGLVRGEMLSPGAIVIDGGMTRVGDKVRGDVDLSSVTSLSGWIAPVPGGVGPLTVASLLERVAERALCPKKNLSVV